MSTQQATTLAEYISARMQKKGISSIHALAREAGVAPETARQVLIGSNRTPSERTLERIAKAVGGSLKRMRMLAGQPSGELEPFILPPEANRLNARQRQVVLSMISALLNTPDYGEDGGSAGPVAGETRSAPRLVGRLRDTDGSAE